MNYLEPIYEKHIENLEEDRKTIIRALFECIVQNIPDGFSPTIQYNMLSFVVPLSLYPAGYHCTPNTPLPFVSIASQKNHIALYHMGIYAYPTLYSWFEEELKKLNLKVDMGKSCIRFSPKKEIPYTLIGNLIQKMSVEEWVNLYEQMKNKKG